MDHLRSAGVPTAVVTGQGPRSARFSLEVLGIADHFDAVEAGSINGAAKAEKITRILDMRSVSPRTAIYVGDHPSDAVEAHKAGTIVAAAAWSNSTDIEAVRRSGPDEFLDSSLDFASWLVGRTTPG